MQMFGIGRTRVLSGVAALVALGCNSFDAEPTDQSGTRLVIPIDEREVSTSAARPATISGGSLTVLADDSAAIIADPERDRVTIVDLAQKGVRASVALEPGDEPGRVIEGIGQRVHVALRGSGAVATIDATTGTLVERRPVCKSPRGLAFEPATQLVHVACAEGKLVSLPALGGAAVRTVALPVDVRDVLVRNGELWLSRFKSAQLLRVDASGKLTSTAAIARRFGTMLKHSKTQEFESTEQVQVEIDAGVAWRAVANPAGGAVIVHQEEVVDDIPISEPSANGSAYGGGGGFSCDGIVKNAITFVAPNGDTTTRVITGAPLPVDVAVSPDQSWLAVAHAGQGDPDAPRPFVQAFGDQAGGAAVPSIGPAGFFGGSLSLHSMSQLTSPDDPGCASPAALPFVSGQATAVAFTSTSHLLVLTREPPTLSLLPSVRDGAQATSIPLPGDSRVDTGHDIFHRDAGGGIACASCHPEGGEDGKTWRFVGTGARRTQPLNVGLRDTAPFHWAGDLDNMGALMSEVFVGRMGGVRESAPRLAALSEWLFTLPAPPAIRDADAATARGQALFESAEVGCASCHSGSKLTNNETVAIDTSAKTKLQVPSLVGLGHRAPFMHTGCAQTLADRFNPACGGDAHGNTAQLTAEQTGDLIAYLESL